VCRGAKTPTDLYCMLLKRKELWLRGVDLNHRPLGYEPNELPGCSTPHFENNRRRLCGQIVRSAEALQGQASGAQQTRL
jgi:hypothetical protein